MFKRHRGKPGYRLSFDGGRLGGVPMRIYGISTPWCFVGIFRTDKEKMKQERKES